MLHALLPTEQNFADHYKPVEKNSHLKTLWTQTGPNHWLNQVYTQNIGDTNYKGGKLTLGQGDCDSDADCQKGMKCWQRSHSEQPTFAMGVLLSKDAGHNWDYCVMK